MRELLHRLAEIAHSETFILPHYWFNPAWWRLQPRIFGLRLQKLLINLRLFLNERRMARLKVRMLPLKRLDLIAQKYKARFDFGERASGRDEFLQFVEDFNKRHRSSEVDQETSDNSNTVVSQDS